MFFQKKKKKNKVEEALFKREAYIPKKRLEKKERSLSSQKGKQDTHKKEYSLRKGIVIFLWLIFIAEVLYVLLFANFFTITQITVEREGESTLAEDQLKNFLQSSWEGKWLGMVEKNNLLLINSLQKEKKLLERFPKIEGVMLTRSFPHSLIMRVSEKPYQIVWCRKEDCFLVNQKGTLESADIFFQYPDEQGRSVRIQDTAEEEVHVGKEVLQEEDMFFLQNLIRDFSLRTGLEMRMPLERPNIHAWEIRVRTEKDFLIYFNTHLSVEESLNNLMLVLQKEIPESDWDKVDYIDLRTENRVYYTRKDKAPEKTEEQKKREEEKEKEEERKREEEEKKNN